ncbi:tip elongation aberrant protein 1 isoform X1 [Herrania umbratica]|uniref:Tip elongation aberrant protein 1 isoform X1 n=1 Tax=Herrania umbratica TaxID=108875 RepID=A0A6J1AU27_9ROSI|nr:tip elongation aberrant protein 1 isoform X1 [Herrania umbratica]XP_021290693.1 tip elongation aberrant protein 1 isoform X1 [Herrania umbratica]
MKMFSFSRRRMKLGRVKKVQLSDSAHGIKSPIRPPKRSNNTNGESAMPAGGHSDAFDSHCPSTAPEINSSGNSENWMVLSVAGERPVPRFNHAAAVIGNKMIVVGGESGNGLLDDVQVLNFDNFSWSMASSKLYLSPSSLPLKIPACKGHSLVSWGKKALLVGGRTDPGNDRVSVWAFDTETECWSVMEAKGEIPVARSGHSVVRASSVLILFGGEDAKKKKLNDLHMFDLKSLTWLTLQCTGTRPSPRANHVATLYDDKTLFIFGGVSKSRALNDLYSLDFETMIWTRIKVRGFHPSPRAGCCGVLCGTKWYIAGGGSRKKSMPHTRHAETSVYDILKSEWSLAIASPPSSITTNKGFSLVLVQHKDKDFLVAFGGCKREPSNQVEVLIIEKNESSIGRRSTPGKPAGLMQFGKRSSSAGSASQLINGSSQRPVDSARQNLASVIEHGSGRRSLSELSFVDQNPLSGNVSLRKQFHNEEEYNTTVKITKCSEDESSIVQVTEPKPNQFDTSIQIITAGTKISSDESFLFEPEGSTPQIEGIANVPIDNDNFVFPEADGKSAALSAPSSIYQFYETRMAALSRKNGILEVQLGAALASRDTAERNLASALKSKEEMEKRFIDTMKEMELLKEKLAGIELAQEEANSLSNIVHSDNVRLEHDVAFLKAVLDDTQKELHSTRGVLAGERARAFQLQVEVFHLKQRLQSLENRAPTPRKPFNV